MKWTKVHLPAAKLKFRTEKSVLIELPNSPGWRFWFPAKIARQEEDDGVITLSIPPDFIAKIFRSEKGAGNRWTKAEEKELSRDEFIEVLRGEGKQVADEPDLQMVKTKEIAETRANDFQVPYDDDDIPF